MTRIIKSDIIYGPVPSRRLGRSLGINHIPPKICSYACNYCQLGNTLKMQITRESFYTPKSIFDAVQDKVAQIRSRNESIDYLALVPDGEPTLDSNLGEIISLLKTLDIPVAVISNATLITDPEVRSALNPADWVSLKVDTVNEGLWRKIDHPHRNLKLPEILDGILTFRKEYKGFLATETMMVKGFNDTESAALETGAFLGHLQPDAAYISIPTRPPADKTLRPAGADKLNLAYQIFTGHVKHVELLTGYEGNEFASTGDVRNDILSITAVHPMRQDAVKDLLAKSGSDWGIVDTMVEKGEILQLEFSGSRFYLRSF